jgi:predicted house-cleaning noncanonical NTP pyrophosphatase (MazG superfamily)
LITPFYEYNSSLLQKRLTSCFEIHYDEMVEALAVVGIVANIIQLVDFGSRVLKRLEEYRSELGDILEAFRHIKIELPVLLDALR